MYLNSLYKLLKLSINSFNYFLSFKYISEVHNNQKNEFMYFKNFDEMI